MVAYKDILASNALISDATAPQVAVFVGATSGIGQLTVRALVATGASMRIYLVGRRSAADRMQTTFFSELRALNRNVDMVWLEGEISLLAETKRLCDLIRARERHVDLLFLSAGYAPFGGTRHETAEEGIDIVQSLEYYSRILFVQLLLPLLNQAKSGSGSSGRVVSVLSGSMVRKTMDLDDIDLKQPGRYSMMTAQLQCGQLNSVALDKLADEYEHVTFLHSWPGWVDTGNVWRGLEADPTSSWWMWWVVRLLLQPLISLFSFRDQESAQRHLFQCTSAYYGGHGTPFVGGAGNHAENAETGVNTCGETAKGGFFLVNFKCTAKANKNMTVLRENAREKVWDHTQSVLQPYL